MLNRYTNSSPLTSLIRVLSYLVLFLPVFAPIASYFVLRTANMIFVLRTSSVIFFSISSFLSAFSLIIVLRRCSSLSNVTNLLKYCRRLSLLPTYLSTALLLVVCLYLSHIFYSISVSGLVRDDLVAEQGLSKSVSSLSLFLGILCPFFCESRFIRHSDNAYRLLSCVPYFAAILFSSLCLLSRSDLLVPLISYSVFATLTCRFGFKSSPCLFLVILSIPLVFVMLTAFQGRSAFDLFDAFANVSPRILSYNVSTIFLAEALADYVNSIPLKCHLFTPVFGTLAERLADSISICPTSSFLSLYDNTFFYSFVRFGHEPYHVSNVFYGTPAFFMAFYSPYLGLLMLSLVLLFASFVIPFRYFSPIYLVYFIVFFIVLSTQRHPLLNGDSLRALLTPLLFDNFLLIMLRLRIRALTP